MTEKYLERYRVGPFDWYDWIGLNKINISSVVDYRIWSFKINKIEILSDDMYGKNIFERFEVLPAARDSWANWGDYATEMDNIWTQMWWFLVLQDKGIYYVLDGPYSGG